MYRAAHTVAAEITYSPMNKPLLLQRRLLSSPDSPHSSTSTSLYFTRYPLSEMAHFSSNTDHKGVDRILSQATDLVVLEQTAALHLAGVVSDSDLETRFRRLKAGPSSFPSQPGVHPRNSQLTSAKSQPTKPDSKGKLAVRGSCRHRKVPNRVSNPDPESSSKCRSKSGSIPHCRPPPPSNRSSEGINRSRLGEESNKNDGSGNGETRRELETDPRLASRSPPKTTGCLWWSSKRAPKSKSSVRRRKKDDEFDWESTEEALKDLGSLSVKEQRQILRKAMEQQRKISKEAVKIVKLAKPATSARRESRS